MKYFFVMLFLLTALNVIAQKNLRQIKQAKTYAVNVSKLPFRVDQIKEDGETILGGGSSISKRYECKGNLNLISVTWLDMKSSSNQLANAAEVNNYYFLQKSASPKTYYQFYTIKGGGGHLLEITKANLIVAFGEDYKEQIDLLEKITFSTVKKMVKNYNTTHPEI